LSRVYSKNPDVIFRTVADECILVPVKKSVSDMESIYSLNQVAACVWQLIDGENSDERIRELLADEFDVPDEQLENDLQAFLNLLKNERIIEEA